MKKVILMLCCVFGLFLSSQAQKVPTAKELADKNVEELNKRLKLSPTQRSVIYNYAFDMAKRQLDLYKKQMSGMFRPEDETAFFKHQNETNLQIKSVLKPEQVDTYNLIIEERLSGVDPNKKKKKNKKGEEEDKVVGIEGLKTKGNN